MVEEFLLNASNVIWGPVMLMLLLGTGIYFMLRLRFLPLRRLGYALKTAFGGGKKSQGEGDISAFQTLMTTLAATIGTGNIAGVATAIAIGGPGALFWMWVTALLGMATAYAETVLSVKYRQKGKNGMMCGGPMYVLRNGLKHKAAGRILAGAFALFTVFVSLGTGNMTQANTVALAVKSMTGLNPSITGVAVAVLTALVLIGGIKSIGKVSEKLVPFMGIFYMLGGLIVICINIQNLLPGITGIFCSAFNGQAAAGGFAGATFAAALQKGVSRGLFSNEAGMGSAGIAAAAAKTDRPARQGLISMTGVFIDTLVICTVTGLVIAASGAWKTGANGVDMTIRAFETGLPGLGGIVVTVSVILFAYCTIIGWEYFGEKAVEYLFGSGIIFPYRIVYCVLVYFGCVFSLNLVWAVADIANALMALPNLAGLLVLRKVVCRETDDFMAELLRNERLLQRERSALN